MSLDGDIEPEKVGDYQKPKTDLQEEIGNLRGEATAIEEKRKATARHLNVSELAEGDCFRALGTGGRHLVDTVKMIAYRAETAMAHALKQTVFRNDDARSLLRAVYGTEADLSPDNEKGILTTRVHHLANHASDNAIPHLCDQLNEPRQYSPVQIYACSMNLYHRKTPELRRSEV